MYDAQGHALTAPDADAVRGYNDAVTQMLDYRLSAMPTLKATLDAAPDFYMGHILRGYMLLLMNSSKMLGAARTALAEAERCVGGVTPREALHLDALRAYVKGDTLQAIARLETVLAAFPRDLIALRVHHAVAFWAGRSQVMMSGPSGVEPAWDDSVAGYGNVLGMLGFGMEECGQYAQAERYGRRAVELNPDDLWAVHSVAHVLEMQGRHADGLAWLDYPADAFADRNPFRGHIWWHRGLYLLEAGQLDAALALYDQAIYDTQSRFYLDLQNAAAFLIRLEFLGMDVGARWDALADAARDGQGDHALAFTDIHNVLALARAGRLDEARGFVQSMRDYAGAGDDWSADVQGRIGVPMAESFIAFAAGDFDAALSQIGRYKPILIDIGASHAQRDVVNLFEIEAAKRGGKGETLQHLLRQRAFITSLASIEAFS